MPSCRLDTGSRGRLPGSYGIAGFGRPNCPGCDPEDRGFGGAISCPPGRVSGHDSGCFTFGGAGCDPVPGVTSMWSDG